MTDRDSTSHEALREAVRSAGEAQKQALHLAACALAEGVGVSGRPISVLNDPGVATVSP